MMNYRTAFRLPFSDRSMFLLLFLAASLSEANRFLDSGLLVLLGSSRLVFGLVAALIPLVVLVSSLFFYGYGFSIAENAAKGGKGFPAVGPFFETVFAPVKFAAALLVLNLPFIFLLLSLLSILGAGLAIFPVFLLLVLGLSLVFLNSYLPPLMLVHFAVERRFTAFFDLDVLVRRAFTRAYFVPWLVAFLFAFGLLLLLLLVLLLAWIVSLLAPEAVFMAVLSSVFLSALYGAVVLPVMMSIYGQAYCSASGNYQKI